MTITAVLPAFNEASRIGPVIADVCAFVDEVTVIDDGSSDDTGEVAARTGAVVIRHERNRGYIAGIKSGFQNASSDIVVTFDSDGEFPAAVVPQLTAPIADASAEMVQGRRNLVPRPSEAVLSWMARFGGPVGDTGTGLRAIRTDLARMLQIRGSCICGVLALEVLERGGRIAEVPVTLTSVDKPRSIAWKHVGQFFSVLVALVRVAMSRLKGM